MFTVVYQYHRLVPRAYEFKIFGITFSDKIWVYATATQVSDSNSASPHIALYASGEIAHRGSRQSFQLALSYAPATLLLAACGIATGYIYRADILQLKGWRVPQKYVRTSRPYPRLYAYRLTLSAVLEWSNLRNAGSSLCSARRGQAEG